jgi:TPP-dependent pyruvate/acetoin dehydrogenase alpha subunit
VREKAKQDVRVALKTSIETLKPSINQLFDDVYENNPSHILE